MILLQLYLYLYESSCNRLMIFSARQLNETAKYIVSVYLSLLIPRKFAVLWSISYRFIWRSQLRRPVWISLLYFHRIHRIVILFGKIYKTFWTFFPLLRRKRIPRVTRHEGQVNREAAISVIPNWPFEERPSVIRERAWFQKKKKIPATALAQRSKASNLFNAATIRACFIDVHAIDSELPLHSEWFGHEETNHAPSNKKLSRHSGSWKTMRYRAFM